MHDWERVGRHRDRATGCECGLWSWMLCLNNRANSSLTACWSACYPTCVCVCAGLLSLHICVTLHADLC
jgi:hypothetical protein